MTKNANRLALRAASFVALFAFVFGAIVPAEAQRRTRRPARRAAPVVRRYTVPTNTVIRVRMDTQLNSKTARTGDRFSATVTEPVYGGESGLEVIPVGSKVWGRVTQVKRAGRRSPGTINASFYQVQLPSGVRQAINGSLSSLRADDVNSDNEGTVAGRGNRKRDAVFIGGGAATGARVYEREQDAEVKSGTEFGVILNRGVRLPEYNRAR